MMRFIITGLGTNAGKTIVSAILTTWTQGNYWKPIECGEEEGYDSQVMTTLLDPQKHTIYPPAYSLKAALSPHHAARLENVRIEPERLVLPSSSRVLVIETAGGVLVPISSQCLTVEVFSTWKAHWIIVSSHYLGSINHTLLTIEALKQRHIPILGLIFNGEHNEDTEQAILQNSKVPCLGRLLPEPIIDYKTVQKYAKQWSAKLSQIIPKS